MEMLDVWKSGTGKVIEVGDLVYRDHHPSTLYKVRRIQEFPDRVEVEVYGGKRTTHIRTFLAETLHQSRKPRPS